MRYGCGGGCGWKMEGLDGGVDRTWRGVGGVEGAADGDGSGGKEGIDVGGAVCEACCKVIGANMLRCGVKYRR